MPRELPEPDELLEGQAGEAQLELLHTETEIARRTAALSLARKLLARRVIRAPMDGIVLERNIEPGESIPASPPGPPLFVIGADPAALRLEVEIDERYVGGVLPGAVTFTAPAYGAYAFSGTIREVIPAPSALRSPRPYLVVVDVANRDGALRPGMSAVVDLPVVTGRDALAVPNAALSSRSAARRSWLSFRRTTAAAEAIAVAVGVANADLTEVMGPGIAAGRLVVTDASPSTCLVGPLPRWLLAPRPSGTCCRPRPAARNCCANGAMRRGVSRARTLLWNRPHENTPSRRDPRPRGRLFLGSRAGGEARGGSARGGAQQRRDLDPRRRPAAGDKAPRARSQSLNLDSLPLVDSQRFDAQYGASHAFRGIALANVIASFAPDPALDVAILHFANGMAVPIPFRDAAVMKRLDPFVARGMETHAKGPVRAAFFTEIRRKGTTEDPRPIVFSGNKLVVPVLWHPAVAAAAPAARSRPGGTSTR